MTPAPAPDRPADWFRIVFLALAVVVAGAAAVAIVAGINRPTQPWGVFTQAAHVGEPPADGQTLTRTIDAEGFPIVDSAAPVWTTVRCGPHIELEVTSARSWEILGVSGPVDAGAGVSAAFTFGPLNDEDEPPCYPVSFSTVPLDADVLDLADGRPIRFSLTIVSKDFAPVVVTSEWFVVDAEPFATSQLDIAIPIISPLR